MLEISSIGCSAIQREYRRWMEFLALASERRTCGCVRHETDEQKEEYDKLRRRVLWKMPYGLYVVGSRSGSNANLMTLNW